MGLLSKEIHAPVYTVSYNDYFRILRGATQVACCHHVMSIVVMHESDYVYHIIGWVVDGMSLIHMVSLTAMHMSHLTHILLIRLHHSMYHFATP